MKYTRNDWVDDSVPALSAENLNRMEDGIEGAYTEIENAKKLADTNTIVIKSVINVPSKNEEQKQYQIPIDDFSFDKYWIFGYVRWKNEAGNIHWTDDKGYGYDSGFFEAHEPGILTICDDYSSGNSYVNIDASGVLQTYSTNSNSKYGFITMCIIPHSTKTLTEL